MAEGGRNRRLNVHLAPLCFAAAVLLTLLAATSATAAAVQTPTGVTAMAGSSSATVR
jgi:hypothetical protein